MPSSYPVVELVAATVILILLGLLATVIPGLVRSIEETEKFAIPKADQPMTRPVTDHCSQQAWPHFDRSCLRNGESAGSVRVIKPQ